MENDSVFRIGAGGKIEIYGYDAKMVKTKLAESGYFYADSPPMKVVANLTGVYRLEIAILPDQMERADVPYRKGLSSCPAYVRCDYFDEVLLGDTKIIKKKIGISHGFGDSHLMQTWNANRVNWNFVGKSMTVHYRQEESLPVYMNIFDIKGRLLKRIIGQGKDAGWHSISWDGRLSDCLTTGQAIFILQLNLGNQNIEKMMIKIQP